MNVIFYKFEYKYMVCSYSDDDTCVNDLNPLVSK